MNTPLSRQIQFRILTVMIGIIAAFLICEGALRLSGFYLSEYRHHSLPTPDFSDPEEFRIVCLGESTTDINGYGSPSEIWTSQLLKMLEVSPLKKRFKIFNIAVSGTTTNQQVFSFLEYLPLVRPHLVISMMGINDTTNLEYLRKSGIQSLRIVKVFQWLVRGYQAHQKEKLHFAAGEVANLIGEKLRSEEYKIDPDNLEMTKNKFSALVETYPRELRYKAYQVAGEFLRVWITRMHVDHPEILPLGKYREGAKILYAFLEKSFELNPRNPEIVGELIHSSYMFLDSCSPDVLQKIKFYFSLGGELNPSTLKSLPNCFGGKSDAEMDAIFEAHNIRHVPSESHFSFTRKNYLKLARVLKENQIPYMAMQYPTGTLYILKSLFSVTPDFNFPAYRDALYFRNVTSPPPAPFEDVIYVSNENFNGAVKKDGWATYFVDKIVEDADGRTFGHTTARGHELIAKNAAGAIIEYWPKIQKARGVPSPAREIR